MLPTLKQRLLITVAVLVGGLCWLLLSGVVSAGNGSTGIALIDARVGFMPAVLLVLLAGLPALALGTLASTMANPLAGVFTMAAGLWMLAGSGGDSRGFLWRRSLPGDYVWLILELLIWTGLYALLLWLTSRSRLALRRRLPGLTSPAGQTRSLIRDAVGLPTVIVCVVTTAIAAVLCHLMIKDSDAGQVLGSLAFAFLVASVLGHMIVPGASALGVLLSPLLLAIGGYLYVMMNYSTHDAVLTAWYGRELPGLAWTLPIHYASAAVAGCSLGVGVAQGLDAARTGDDVANSAQHAEG